MSHESKRDRRSEDFHFYSLLELFDYFSNFLSSEEMDTAVRESAQGFTPRQFETDEMIRLQFVKKCEFVMDTLAQLKEAGVYTRLEEFNEERREPPSH